MKWMMVVGLIFIAVYCSVRYAILKNALKHTTQQLTYIGEDILQNRQLYLSVPDKELEAFSIAVNQLICRFQEERIRSDCREQAFQGQIEAVSHDLRTPLTVIAGYLSMLRMQNKECSLDGEVLSDVIDILQRKTAGMEQLVNQFYEYSRVIAQDTTLECEAVDINKMVRETLLNNVMLLEQAGIQVAFESDSVPIWVFGDASAIERIISNLLENVARYAKANLTVDFRETANEIQLLMKNDTEKLREEDVAHLFERFYAANYARSEGSTGLGLTIAKGLVEEMDGHLQANVLPESMGDDCLWICFTVTLKKVSEFIVEE